MWSLQCVRSTSFFGIFLELATCLACSFHSCVDWPAPIALIHYMVCSYCSKKALDIELAFHPFFSDRKDVFASFKRSKSRTTISKDEISSNL